MMKYASLALFATLGIFSCQEKSNRSVPGTIMAPPSSVLLQQTEKRLFSDSSQHDFFSLTVTGDSLLNASAEFEITSASGKKLYAEVFRVADMLQYADHMVNATQQEAYLRDRIKNFFKAELFQAPATAALSWDADYTPQADWQDIQSDTNVIGYEFVIHEEWARRIAYSKKRKKVVVYFSCC